MHQDQIVQEPRDAVLKWQVVEAHPAIDAWVIAAFENEDDAETFAKTKRRCDITRSTYSVRESPEWAALRRTAEAERALRRRPEITLELAGRDA